MTHNTSLLLHCTRPLIHTDHRKNETNFTADLQRFDTTKKIMIYITLGPDENLEVREKSIRKRLEVYTEVYIVFICVYFHVILPYLVSTLLPLLYENMRIILTGP